MALTNAGRDLVAQALVGEAFTAFDAAGAHVGVGDSAVAFAATHTDLQAGGNKLRKAMEATYPQRAANVMTFRALFGTAEANWVWAEWATFNAAAAGVMLQRKVEALGTKTNAQSWELTAELTIVAA